MGDARWDPVATAFVDHYESLYGQVRTHVLNAHLTEHLPSPPAEIVDIGGGAGHQSIPLARAGYRVTIVDPSTVMLAEATRMLEAEPRDVAARVRLVEADGESASQLLGGSGFDGVLCHGVLMYLDDPVPLVNALCERVRSGGMVSVVTKNRRTLAMRPALEGDWAGALAAFDSHREINGLDIETRADDVNDLGDSFAVVVSNRSRRTGSGASPKGGHATGRPLIRSTRCWRSSSRPAGAIPTAN